MPSSKTDTAVRFPESEDQKRRLRNTTQDTKRAQTQAALGSQRTQQVGGDQTTLSPEQLLGEHMDASGNPIPDAPSYGKSNRAKLAKDEPDLFHAMTDETEDFE